MIDGRKRDRAELIAELVDAVEFVGVVRGGGFAEQGRRLVQRPAIERVHLRDGDGVFREVEIEEVGKLVAETVAKKTIRLADVFQDFVVDGDVVAEILGGDPEADDIGAVGGDVGVTRLGFLIRAALGDFLAGFVDDEAVGEDGFVGRAAEGDDARPKGGLEPTTMLVAALEIEIGGPLGGALLGP